MTNEHKKNEFTVQEVDPPVPVGVGGAGTGHPRPLSCDSPAPSVVYQAGVQRTTTGWRGDPDSSRNKKSLLRELRERTDGTRSAPGSPNVASVDLTWDDEAGRSVKRRRQGPGNREVEELEHTGAGTVSHTRATVRKLIGIMDKEIRLLAKVVQENSNTKREIKDLSSSLRSLSSRLMTDAIQLTLTVDPSDRDIVCKETGTQTEFRHSSRDMSTQTLEEEDELPSAEIIRELSECDSDEKFLELLGKPWPESVYEHTVVVYEDPLQDDTDLALFVPGGDMDTETMAGAAARFPKLKGMGKECQTDYIGSVLHATSTRDGDLVSKKERLVYKIVPAEMNGRVPVLEFTQALNSLGRHMDLDGKDRVALLRSPGISMDDVRKGVEYAFRNTGRKIMLHEPAPRRAGASRPLVKNSAVVVKTGDKSFAEALKDMKERLCDSEAVKLQAVRKTQQGDILLVVKGSVEGAKKLQDEIRSKTGMAAYAKDGDRKTLLIQGLDGVTTKEEVVAAVQDHLKSTDSRGFTVSSLRQTRRDSQIATLLTSSDIAERLLADGRLRIGWLECRVKERIDLPKCFKCLEYGHTRINCKGPSREDVCFKCGKPGHVAKDSTGQVDFCHACQKEGHRSSSTNCPIFRKMISEARDRARLGRGSRSGRTAKKK